MRDLQQEALTVIDTMKGSPYIVIIGDTLGVLKLPIGANFGTYYDEKYLFFHHNLGSGAAMPRKAAATAILHEIEDYYLALRAASPEFCSFVGEHKFMGQLLIFSGHYDVYIANIRDGVIEWESNVAD